MTCCHICSEIIWVMSSVDTAIFTPYLPGAWIHTHAHTHTMHLCTHPHCCYHSISSLLWAPTLQNKTQHWSWISEVKPISEFYMWWEYWSSFLACCISSTFWRPVSLTQLLTVSPLPPTPSPPPPPPPDLAVCRTAPLSPFCYSVCVCVCVTASGGGGSQLNPSSLLATERFGAGQGMGAGCSAAGEEQSPPGLER